MRQYLGVLAFLLGGIIVLSVIAIFTQNIEITGNVVLEETADIYAPEVSISFPENAYNSKEEYIQVYGTANDNDVISSVKVKINSGSWIDSGTEQWATTIRLTRGQNTIYVQSFDNSGNPSPVSAVTVYY